MALKVWTNDADLVIAETPEEATKIVVESEDLYTLSDATAMPWEELTEPIVWREDESDPIATAPRKTPEQLIAEYGPGYLAALDIS